jgi:uncharacterized protein
LKLLVFADLHFVDYFKWREFLTIDHARFDAVLLLGDIDIMFLKSITENFTDKPIAGVLGNHDYKGDLEYYEISNLHGKVKEVGTCKILGVEGCVRYKKRDSETPLYEQEEIRELLETLSYADIVASHNSPKGIHDRAGIAHEGYEGLIEYMNTHSPRYVLHGHQHINQRTSHENTIVIGMYGGLIFDTDTGETELVLDLNSMEYE